MNKREWVRKLEQWYDRAECKSCGGPALGYQTEDGVEYEDCLSPECAKTHRREGSDAPWEEVAEEEE